MNHLSPLLYVSQHVLKLPMSHCCKTKDCCKTVRNASSWTPFLGCCPGILCNWVMWPPNVGQVHLWGGASVRAAGIRHAQEDEGDHWLAGWTRRRNLLSRWVPRHVTIVASLRPLSRPPTYIPTPAWAPLPYPTLHPPPTYFLILMERSVRLSFTLHHLSLHFDQWGQHSWETYLIIYEPQAYPFLGLN